MSRKKLFHLFHTKSKLFHYFSNSNTSLFQQIFEGCVATLLTLGEYLANIIPEISSSKRASIIEIGVETKPCSSTIG
jgi:hypothetical protein